LILTLLKGVEIKQAHFKDSGDLHHFKIQPVNVELIGIFRETLQHIFRETRHQHNEKYCLICKWL